MDPDPAGQRGSLTPPALGEFAAIARWTTPRTPAHVHTGPGDDVAWLQGCTRPLALSVDTVVEGVHFRFDWSSPEDVGWKAAAAALSDLAASRARPTGALVSLCVPRGEFAPGGRADRCMAGLRDALDTYGCPLLGGDTVRTDGPTTISVTVIGAATAAGPLLRSEAQPGDLILLSGPTGRAGFAVETLLAGDTPDPAFANAHRRPTPRLDLVDALAPATAGIDVSDGLLADAAWIARASGVALVLDRDALPASGAPERCMLGGGDDYELLVTAPQPLPGFHVIGAVAPGPAALRWSDGTAAEPAGWEHA